MFDNLTKKHGFTLIELIVAMGFFAILTALVYGTFNLIQKQVTAVNDVNTMQDKGQRILNFVEEDLRMIGFLLGPEARVPYCSNNVIPTDPNIIEHTSGTSVTPYDTITFLTSQAVRIQENSKSCMEGQKDEVGQPRVDYYLTTVGSTDIGDTSINVDAKWTNSDTSCYKDIASYLITFDSLRMAETGIGSSGPKVFYKLEKSENTVLKLPDTEPLEQAIPDNSTVYEIKRFEYSVDTTGGGRNLRRTGWNKDCSRSNATVVTTSNDAKTAGGVDGLKFEYTYIDSMTDSLVTAGEPPESFADLKSITVWILLRSDRLNHNFKNTKTYVLGNSPDKITLGPFDDYYRRILLYRTVEVKNLASIF